VFSLSFVRNPDRQRFAFDPDTETIGRICLDEFEEYFPINITFWSADQYRAQWREALKRICEGADTSCLLTSVDRPDGADTFFDSWFIYRFGAEVVFHNKLLLAEKVGDDFSLDRLCNSAPCYNAISEDGAPISEWRMPLMAVEEFLAGELP
jgi:hypothetical protein